jgi:hypothetical protein
VQLLCRDSEPASSCQTRACGLPIDNTVSD